MDHGQLIITVLEIVLGAFLAFIMKLVKEVRDDLRTQNGRVGRLEEWSQWHNKADDERYADIKAQLSKIWNKLNM